MISRDVSAGIVHLCDSTIRNCVCFFSDALNKKPDVDQFVRLGKVRDTSRRYKMITQLETPARSGISARTKKLQGIRATCMEKNDIATNKWS